MAKYIISERQYKLIAEMQIPSGRYETEPIFDFYSHITDTKSPEQIEKFTRKYLESHVGLDTSKISDEDIFQYVNRISYQKLKPIPKYFYKPGIVSGLSYYLANKFFKLQKSPYGLSYYVDKQNTYRNFWFFDSEIKDFVGRISVQVDDDYPSPSFKINVSSVEPAFIGRGYGVKMYLTLINLCEYLISDTLLYKDSLNIWTNVLPKYVNVWARHGDEFLPLKKKFINPENIKYYVASKKHNDI